MQSSQSSNLLWRGRLAQPWGIFAAERLPCNRFGMLMHERHLLAEGQVFLRYPMMFRFDPALLYHFEYRDENDRGRFSLDRTR